MTREGPQALGSKEIPEVFLLTSQPLSIGDKQSYNKNVCTIIYKSSVNLRLTNENAAGKILVVGMVKVKSRENINVELDLDKWLEWVVSYVSDQYGIAYLTCMKDFNPIEKNMHDWF